MAHIIELFARKMVLPALAITLIVGALPVSAADKSDKSAKSDKKVSVAQPSAQSSAAAANPVKAAAINEERQLRMMGEAIKRLRRSASDLASECSQPLEMMGEIDIIGTDVIPIMPATAEGFGNQYIPPRPKYVNLHMGHLGDLIPILEDDLNTLTIPDAEKDAATPLLADALSSLADVKKRYATLQSLTVKGTDYDANAIVNECQAIHKATGQIDSDRKKLLHEDKKIEKENK